MALKTTVVGIGAGLALWLGSGVVWGQAPPNAEQVRAAAEAFDAASAAYQAARFELAASRFEAAHQAVASARTLRMAIRSRERAKHRARAATLAALAKKLYQGDDKTVAMASDVIERLGRELHHLDVRCSSPCVLALGARVVPGKPARRREVFVLPGKVTVSASFVDDRAAEQQEIVARVKGRNVLRFEGKEAVEPLGPSKPQPTPQPSSPPPASALPNLSLPGPDQAAVLDGPSWIASPVVFFSILGATAVAGGVTIWSGVDTINNPGQDAVRAACAGKGSDCAEYQQGRASQLRTNVLIGVTASMAALSGVVGLFVTDWGAEQTSPKSSFVVGPAGGLLRLSGGF